jgi:hypothetical protein
MPQVFEATWDSKQRPTKSGKYVTDSSKVAQEVMKYWKSLYERKPTNSDDYHTCLDTLRTGNKVQPPTAAQCDAPITVEEITNTCNTLPTAKSAGPDRIPNMFYKSRQ